MCASQLAIQWVKPHNESAAYDLNSILEQLVEIKEPVHSRASIPLASYVKYERSWHLPALPTPLRATYGSGKSKGEDYMVKKEGVYDACKSKVLAIQEAYDEFVNSVENIRLC